MTSESSRSKDAILFSESSGEAQRTHARHSGSSLKEAFDSNSEAPGPARVAFLMATRFEHFLISDSLGLMSSCGFAIGPEEVTISLPSRTASVPLRTVVCLGITRTEADRRGVFLRAIEDADIRILLVPSETEWDKARQERLVETVYWDLSEAAPQARHDLSNEEVNAAALLWDLVLHDSGTNS